MGQVGKRKKQIRSGSRAQIPEVSRRHLIRQLAGLTLGLPLAQSQLIPLLQGQQQNGQHQHIRPAAPPVTTPLSPQDDQFLNDVEQANFLFFWEQANPETGLTKDRANVRVKDNSVVGSIASTGFGLTAICIAEKRGFVSRSDARLRIIKTLSFLWHKLPTHRGFFYHFANINTGERIWDSEVRL